MSNTPEELIEIIRQVRRERMAGEIPRQLSLFEDLSSGPKLTASSPAHPKRGPRLVKRK